jgi:hypothetical protein
MKRYPTSQRPWTWSGSCKAGELVLRVLTNAEIAQDQQQGKSAQNDGDELDELEDDITSPKPLMTTFELNDTLYAHAELEDTDTVYLWLGVCIYNSTRLGRS